MLFFIFFRYLEQLRCVRFSPVSRTPVVFATDIERAGYQKPRTLRRKLLKNRWSVYDPRLIGEALKNYRPRVAAELHDHARIDGPLGFRENLWKGLLELMSAASLAALS